MIVVLHNLVTLCALKWCHNNTIPSMLLYRKLTSLQIIWKSLCLSMCRPTHKVIAPLTIDYILCASLGAQSLSELLEVALHYHPLSLSATGTWTVPFPALVAAARLVRHLYKKSYSLISVCWCFESLLINLSVIIFLVFWSYPLK